MRHSARIRAILPVIMGTGHAIAPVIGGQVSSRHGLGVLWVLVGITAIIGAIGVFILYLTEPKHTKAHR